MDENVPSQLLIIAGNPTGKARPRFSHGHAYTPKNTRDYESYVKMLYKAKYKHTEPSNEPIELIIDAVYKIPSNARKTAKKRMLEGTEQPIKKPDADNVAKIIMDALNGLAYGDDKQIVKLSVNKSYGEKPMVIVQIREVK